MKRWDFKRKPNSRSKDAFLFAITKGVMSQLEGKISTLKQHTQHRPERSSSAEL